MRTSHYWGLQAFVAFGFLVHNLLTWFQRDVFGDTGLGDLGLKRFVQDFMRLPAQVQPVLAREGGQDHLHQAVSSP